MNAIAQFRSLVARVTAAETRTCSLAEIEALQAEIDDLRREVESLEAANAYLRSENASLKAKLRELLDRTNVMATNARHWRHDD